MINVETAATADGLVSTVATPLPEVAAPRLRRERVNETRLVRTFTRDEVAKLLFSAVLDEADVSKYSHHRDDGTVELLTPNMPENVWVKVTVQGDTY